MNSEVSQILQGSNPFTQPSFTFRNRLSRICWRMTYVLLFRFSPRPMHGWRRFILRIFGANIGKHCHVYPKVEIWAPWNLKLDDYASIADGCNVYSIDKISLGKKAVVSQGSYLCTGSHDYNSSNFQLIASPISIGANSWIAAQAFIGPGVTIGESAVIGARAVVTCDVAARMVCAGNPCRVIKQRECG